MREFIASVAERGSKWLSLLRLPQHFQDALARAEISVADVLAITALPVHDQSSEYELSRTNAVPVASAVSGIELEREPQPSRRAAAARQRWPPETSMPAP